MLPESFTKFIQSQHLFTSKDRLLIAVSGGVDSVVLCELCFTCGFHFSIAHCNFQLRGEESEGDERFVNALAEKYSVPFFVKKFDTEDFASANKISIQEAARTLRYKWFEELMSSPENELQYLLTAHHADDNVETIVMNFFKGSGINGLKGILAKKGKLVRPLLFSTKEEIRRFAEAQNLSYREDSSNESEKYTRNYFRNQLLPSIEKVFPQTRANLLHNAERFAEINLIYQSAIDKIIAKLVVKKGNEFHIPVLKLQGTAAMQTVLYEIVKDFGFTSAQVPGITKLLHSESGKYIDSGSHRVLRNRNWLIISALHSVDNTNYLLEENDTEIQFGAYRLSIQKTSKKEISNNSLEAQLDLRDIKFPLLLRKWKTGDYFYPLGMKKKKKISRFLIDLKLPLHQKQDVWVLESDKKIMWVLGFRIDDRFKIRDSSTGSLLLRLSPGGQTH